MKLHVAVTSEEIASAESALAELGIGLDPRSGARVVFCGCVRNHDQGKAVQRLHYEAHPAAEAFLAEAVEVATAGKELQTVLTLHRVGDLQLGDIALLVVVDSAHRAEAFAACAQIVDEVKARVPIWKEQYFSDGSTAWSNLP